MKTFRIHLVSEMTGVPVPTLRAWEQRYGFLTPTRSENGYRLYGEADVERIRRMRKLCSEGIAAAEAARLVLRDEERETPASAFAVLATEADPTDDGLGAYISAIFEAVEEFDTLALDRLFRRLAIAAPPIVLVERVITPLLQAVGCAWEEGRFNVAQEHLVSRYVSTLVDDVARIGTPETGPHVLVTCFPEEEHEIPARCIAVQLAVWGYRPVFFGRVPPTTLRAPIRALGVKLVAISTTLPVDRAAARAVLDEYTVVCEGVRWVVGGANAHALEDLVVGAGGLVGPSERGALEDLVRSIHAGKTTTSSRPRGSRPIG